MFSVYFINKFCINDLISVSLKIVFSNKVKVFLKEITFNFMKDKFSLQMLDALRHSLSAYVSFTDEEFNVFSQNAEVRSFGKKHQVSKLGKRETHMNFLITGLARKYFLKGKEELIVQIAKEFDVIYSKSSFEEGRPSLYIVETIEPTTFVSISKQNLEKLFFQIPKMERLGRLIITTCYLQKEAWEYDRMRLNTRDRF